MTAALLKIAIAFVVVVGAFWLSGRLRRARRLGTAFLVNRTAWMAVTLWAVFSLSFVLMRNVPGGPFDRERDLPLEIKRALLAQYRLDRPLPEQYLTTLGDLLSFDFGPSMTLKDYTVLEVLGEGLPATGVLGLLALLWTLGLGLPAGILAASFRGRVQDRALMGVATLGMALPNFVLAGLLLIPLAFVWKWLPPAGFSTPKSLILPSFCLGAPFAAQVARLMRTGLLEVLGSDWIRTARAKGLSETAIVLRHALRGAVIPVITFLGPAMAGILTGSLVIEQIFAIPGIGTHFVQSALARDYPLAMGMVLLYTFTLASLNILVDGLQAALDPRVDLR